MISILLHEPQDFPADAIARLCTVGKVYRADQPYPQEAIEAVFVRLREQIGQTFHQRHPALRYVVSPTTGLNHIDHEYFELHGVKVVSLKGKTSFLDNIHATAEHTLALALALLRRLPMAVQDVNAGHWNRYPFKGGELHGKDVLIFGYGRLGRQVHALYQAFGCNVMAYDVVPERVPEALGCSLEDGVQRADLVSVHVNLEPSTVGVYSDALMSLMHPGAVLINTSRGEILDQDALLSRIETGKLAGAALDVLCNEPAPLSEKVRRQLAACGNRVIVTPHISGFTNESLTVVENYVSDLLIQLIKEG